MQRLCFDKSTRAGQPWLEEKGNLKKSDPILSRHLYINETSLLVHSKPNQMSRPGEPVIASAFLANGPAVPVRRNNVDAEKPVVGHEYGVDMSVDAHFPTVRGPSDTVEYPETMDSLYTMIRDKINNRYATLAGTQPNFGERTAYVALILLLITYMTSFLVFLARVVTIEKGIPFGLEYALICGLAAALQAYITLPYIHRQDGILQLFEIWMKHYSLNMPLIWQRIIFWVVCMIASLGANVLAAWSVWAIQFDNAVTFAGLPLVVGNMWRAFGILLVGYSLIYWVLFHAFYNPEAASDRNNSNAPIMLGIVTTAVTYVAVPFTGGGFSFEQYLATSIISGNWDIDGWVYPAASFGAGILIAVVFYTVARTTKDGSLKNE